MRILYLLFFLFSSLAFHAQENRVIHVFVALCDNVNQGIVKVPEAIGNGQDPARNLYWGAGYGVKHFFDKKSSEWTLIKTIKNPETNILERIIFRHSTGTFLVADAYDGAAMKQTVRDFLNAASGKLPKAITLEHTTINFGGGADLVAFVGHNGLMDFELDQRFKGNAGSPKDAIILACYSKNYFQPFLREANANPLLWTTHLMAPEAYTLKAAIDGWIKKETSEQIRERAAQAYHQYQKCGIKGARNLLVTGW